MVDHPFRLIRAGLLACIALPLALALPACGDDDDDVDGGATELPLNPNDHHHEACADMDRRVVPVTTDMDTDAIFQLFVDAEPGDIIHFEAGRWQMERELSLDAPCVVLKGAGTTETILDWEGTTSGKGIFVGTGADHFTAEDFTILNTFDNGLEVRGTEGIIMRRLHVEWTGDAASSNGRYAVYPVECRNLLMEHNVARRASDAGIYVGQCHNAVIRWNVAEENVSGIQVENTLGAEVYENLSINNTLGFLVHDLPNLATTNGLDTRVYRNAVIANNFQNFANDFDLAFNVPSGTGMIVLARDNVEIFDNVFEDNRSVNFAAVNYLLLNPDFDMGSNPDFDVYPRRIHLYDNTFSGGGDNPDIGRDLGFFLAAIRLQQPAGLDRIPDIVFDNIAPADSTGDNPLQFCIGDDYDGHVLNLNMDLEALIAEDIATLSANLDNEIAPYRCSLDPVPETPMLETVGPGEGTRPDHNR
ncbi:MAG: hypothetical protein EA398_10630 [Deltaproteobacteria bacterium]|nr:MAG: hypothetical protein EA398_10630 [Deltaproteobacteria bacterium]